MKIYIDNIKNKKIKFFSENNIMNFYRRYCKYVKKIEMLKGGNITPLNKYDVANASNYILEKFVELTPTISIDTSQLDPKRKELLFICYDPDANNYMHWYVYNIDPNTTKIDSTTEKHGMNSRGEYKYYGPHPPVGTVHTYLWKLFELNERMKLDGTENLTQILEKIKKYIIKEHVFSVQYPKLDKKI